MSYAEPDSALFARVAKDLHPACEMQRFASREIGAEAARNYYFASGHAFAAALVRALERHGARAQDSTLLDFGSGFGRLTRYFVRLFRRVTVSDLEAEMIEFARRSFGAEGFLSSMDPRSLAPAPIYDVVCSVSLLTHVPPPEWTRWLETLWGWVARGGLLVFTMHPPSLTARFEANGRSRGDPWQGRMSGTQCSMMERPYLELGSRTLRIFGVRMHLERGAQGSRCSGVVALRTFIGSACAPRAVAIDLLDRPDRPGFAITGTAWRWHPVSRVLEIEMRFHASAALHDTPLGPIEARIEFERPTAALVEECSGSPALELWPERFAEFGGPIWFDSFNETGGRLDPHRYGSTTVTPAFVRERLANLPGWGGTEHHPGGAFDLFQDTFVARKS